MRLFVAIDVPGPVKDHIAFLQRSLEHVSGVRWANPRNSHLTLNFLGEQGDPAPIIERLRTITFTPFELTLKGIGYFPTTENPRVIWVGIAEHEGLRSLQAAIDALFTPEKSFKAHLTLGRTTKPTPTLPREAEKLEVTPLRFAVTEFRLYKSTLTTIGPIYEVLETYKAKG